MKRFRTKIEFSALAGTLCSLLVLLLALRLNASFEEKPSSARAAGMGEAMTAVIGDANSLYYNPAGLRFSQHREILSSYTQLFAISDLSYQYFGVLLPTNRAGAWGFSYSQFGPSIFREQDIALSHSFLLAPNAAIGYSLKNSALKMRRYGSTSALGLDLGFVGQIHQKLSAGFSFKNANQPTFSGSPEGPAQSMRAGLAFRPMGGFLTSLDVVKPVEGELSYRAGEEIQLAKLLALRFGVQTAPNRYSAGVGFRLKFFRMDYAFVSHPFLNAEHHASLSLLFGKEELIEVAEPVKKARGKKAAKNKIEKLVDASQKVNINSAGLEDLLTLPGIGRVSAQSVLDYRKEHGSFEEVTDLLKVPRFQRRIFIRVQPYVYAGPAGEEGSAPVTPPANLAEPEKTVPQAEPEQEVLPEPEELQEPEPESEPEPFTPPETPPPAKPAPLVPIAPPTSVPQMPSAPVVPPVEKKAPPRGEPRQDIRPTRGQIDINESSVEELERAGFSPKQAKNIVRFRNRQGRFDSVDDLLKVPGVSERDLGVLREGLAAE